MSPSLSPDTSFLNAIAKVKEAGATDITFVCLLTAPQGVAKLQSEHPDVDIITASVDEGLNEFAYILPGLDGAGDRIFNSLLHRCGRTDRAARFGGPFLFFGAAFLYF